MYGKHLKPVIQIIAEQGLGVTKIQATHCMVMIAGEDERDRFKSLLAKQIARLQAEWIENIFLEIDVKFSYELWEYVHN